MDDLEKLSKLAGIPDDVIEYIQATIADEDTRRKLLEIYKRRAAIQRDIFEQTAKLSEAVTGQMSKLEQIILEFYVVREWMADLAQRIDNIENAVYVIIGQSGGQDIGAKLRQITEKSLQSQLIRLYGTLAIYENQRASYGLDTPAHLIQNIEFTKTEISEIEKKLNR